MEFKLNNPNSTKAKIAIVFICAISFIIIAVPFRIFFPIF